MSWAYFDPFGIIEERLASLVRLAQKRWQDGWLSTRQVADRKGTDTKTVLMAIKRGKFPGIHIHEKDGRHPDSHQLQADTAPGNWLGLCQRW